MLDPLSVSAVTGFLEAVSAGMAGETGRRLGEAVGGVVARVAGREVPAPVGAAEREAVARILVAQARQDPGRAGELGSWMRTAPRTAAPGGGPAPHLLPAPPRFFTDRAHQLTLLDREASRKPDGRPRIALLYGPESIGTTSLALRWGALRADRYPDGTLYRDLRGSSAGTTPTAASVLRHFLLRLHIAPEHIPPATEERGDLFRTLLADRRLLVVLDHAQTAAQVLPLVTAAPGVLTLVVARRPLGGLDAVPVPVGPLVDRDSVRLLTHLVGKEAVKAAKATLPPVLERCAGSPFALRLAAPYLADPATAAPGTGVRQPPSAVEDAYRRLTPEQARVYRLSALRAWPALSAGPVAAATGIGEPEADRILSELAGMLLLDVTSDARYRYRPSVRAHAVQAATREDGVALCAAAVSRTVGWFVRFAVRADLAALPERWHVGPLFTQVDAGRYDTPGAAVAALLAELDNLVEAVLAAAEFGDHDTTCQGTEALWAVQLKAGPYETLLPALRAGARAADAHCPGTDTAGRMHAQLALALMEMPARREEAEAELAAAAAADAQAGHVRGQATAVETLGLLRLRQWRYAEALDRFDAADLLLDSIGPADRGAADLPRARALLERHRGRALRGLGRFPEALARLETALAFFRAPATAEPFNEARVLTDIAEAHRDAGDPAAALRSAEQAAVLLDRENATVHLGYLDVIRRQCRPDQA